MLLRFCVATEGTRAEAFQALRDAHGSFEAAAGLVLERPGGGPGEQAAGGGEERRGSRGPPRAPRGRRARSAGGGRAPAARERRVGLPQAVASGVAANLNRLAAAHGLCEAESLATNAMALEAATEALHVADRLTAALLGPSAAPRAPA